MREWIIPEADLGVMENISHTELVRCKDCKHRIPNPHGYTCKRLFKEVSLDHYCSWGERREDNFFCAKGERKYNEEEAN